MNAFGFLTASDLSLLKERATRARYVKNQTILGEGSERRALFVLIEGMARVELARLGEGVALARLGPGDTFGEMSLLDGAAASASVVAEEDVEVEIVDEGQLTSLLVSVPGFATRFYHSLATSLSERLRTTSARVPAVISDEVPQLQRQAALRPGQLQQGGVPPAFAAAVQGFQATMLQTNRDLSDGGLSDGEARRRVADACNAVTAELALHARGEPARAKTVGDYACRETFSVFMQSRTIDHIFTKPRGYSGDYRTLELLHADAPEGDGRLGRHIDAWALSLPALVGLRRRCATLADLVRGVAGQWSGKQPMPVARLDSAAALELFELLTSPDAPDIHATCIDFDAEALAHTARRATQLGLSDRMSFAQDNVLHLVRNRGRILVPPQQLIYARSLADYLEDGQLVALLNWVFDRLLPTGTVALASFDISNPNRVFMDHILAWELIHRSADDVRRLFAESRFATRALELQRDERGGQLVTSCRKG